MQRPTSLYFGAGATPHVKHAAEDGGARGPKRRRGAGDSVALWIIALSTAWLALVTSVLLVVVALKAPPALDAMYAHAHRAAEHAHDAYGRATSAVEYAHSTYTRTLDAATRLAPSDETLHWAGVLGDALAGWLRSDGLGRAAEASARANEWAHRLEALYHDKRLEVVSQAATDVSNLVETRGSALLADFEAIANTTHALVRRGARRMRALEELLK